MSRESGYAPLDADGQVPADRLTLAPGGAPSGAAGGELGGTYPDPTVDASHGGGTHAATQAAAEATAAGALSGHSADTTAVHGITDTAALSLTSHDHDADYDAIGAAAAAQAASQPVDSDLTAIAALTTTAYGRAFLALADAAAGRTALGLGTAALAATGDFDAAGAAAAAQSASQPLDSDLTAIAALTTTAYGRSLLEAADAAAGRTLLALGTAAVAATGDFEAAGGIATHAGAADPHTGYRLESADHSHATTGLQAGTVAHSVTTGQTADDHHAQLHATAHQPGGGDAMAIDAAAATGSLRTLGAGAAQAAAGDHAHAGATTTYAPGSFTVATGNYALMSKRLQLTTTQRVTLAGTARLRIT